MRVERQAGERLRVAVTQLAPCVRVCFGPRLEEGPGAAGRLALCGEALAREEPAEGGVRANQVGRVHSAVRRRGGVARQARHGHRGGGRHGPRHRVGWEDACGHVCVW